MYIGVSQQTAQADSFISDRMKRKNAEEAYKKIEKYDSGIQEAILQLINEKLGEPDDAPKEEQTLNAGQAQQIQLPIGKTLEETIALWGDVRSEAISTPDYQLVAKASSKIQRAQSQLGLNQQAATEINTAVQKEAQLATSRLSMEFPTKIERTVFEQEQKYKRAISAYSFQVQLKMNGFKVDAPSFLRIA